MDGKIGYRATGEGENRFRSQGNGVTHVTSKEVWAERRKPFETKSVGNRALLVRTSDIQREDRKLSQGSFPEMLVQKEKTSSWVLGWVEGERYYTILVPFQQLLCFVPTDLGLRSSQRPGK